MSKDPMAVLSAVDAFLDQEGFSQDIAKETVDDGHKARKYIANMEGTACMCQDSQCGETNIRSLIQYVEENVLVWTPSHSAEALAAGGYQ